MTKPKILAAVDLVHRESDRHVVEEAITLALAHDADIELIFVIPDQQDTYAQHYVPADMREQVRKDAERDLDAYATEFNWKEVSHETAVLRGVVYNALIERAEETSAMFVVIGASRPTVRDLLIGPNAARVSRYAPCSVMVVRSR